MHRSKAIVLAVILLAVSLSGCGQQGQEPVGSLAAVDISAADQGEGPTAVIGTTLLPQDTVLFDSPGGITQGRLAQETRVLVLKVDGEWVYVPGGDGRFFWAKAPGGISMPTPDDQETTQSK